MTEDADSISVTFLPQEWVDSPGKAHESDRRRLAPADDRDPVTFALPRTDATDASGVLLEDESYEANRLQSHDAAPDWVVDWDGPYRITVDDD